MSWESHEPFIGTDLSRTSVFCESRQCVPTKLPFLNIRYCQVPVLARPIYSLSAELPRWSYFSQSSTNRVILPAYVYVSIAQLQLVRNCGDRVHPAWQASSPGAPVAKKSWLRHWLQHVGILNRSSHAKKEGLRLSLSLKLQGRQTLKLWCPDFIAIVLQGNEIILEH